MRTGDSLRRLGSSVLGGESWNILILVLLTIALVYMREFSEFYFPCVSRRSRSRVERHFVLNVLHSRDAVQGEPAERRDFLDLLLDGLHVVVGDTVTHQIISITATSSPELKQDSPNPPHPPQMPPCLPPQILHRNPTHHHHLRLHRPQDPMIAQIQPIRNLPAHPIEIPVSPQRALRCGVVVAIDLGQPRHAARKVRGAGRPVLAREGVVAVLGAFDVGDGEDGFEGFGNAGYGDEFEEGFAEAADQGLAGGGGLVCGFGDEVVVEGGGEGGVPAGCEGGDGEDVPVVRSGSCLVEFGGENMPSVFS